MKNTDTRVQYTKERFHSALLHLLKTKPINKITVKELCEAASLNRGTFYLHYTEPQDILTEIEDQLYENNMAYLNSYLTPEHDLDNMRLLFTYIMDNLDTFRLIVGKGNDAAFLDRIKYLVKPAVLQDWVRDNPDCRIEDLDFVFDFVFSGAFRLILDLNEHNSMSINEFAHRLDRLGHYSQLAIREFH